MLNQFNEKWVYIVHPRVFRITSLTTTVLIVGIGIVKL